LGDRAVTSRSDDLHSGADAPRQDQQERVNAYFDAAALYWQAIYEDPQLQGVIYRARQRAVLEQLGMLELPAGAQVLELGCGAGLLTSELARRGYQVHAVDASEGMVQLTTWRLNREGLDGHVETRVADAHELPFAAGEFSLVIAVGLLPWLHRPSSALREIARVLGPDGRLIVTADNRARLNTLVDPRANVLLTPLKRLRRRLRPRLEAGARSRLHFPSHVNALLGAAGFRLDRGMTVGFGPFSFGSRPLLPDRAGITLHERLQRLADRGLPVVRSGGWHYLVVAHKQRQS
jgi:ubiquinone/menaquinone biosynthesis C-methylase UbiE